MSDLPDPVKQAGLLFRRGDVQEDGQTREEIINWGYAQIEAEFPEDPVRAPLNGLKRLRARRAWEKVIRTAGEDLRGVIANQDVKDLEFELDRRRRQALAEEDAQRERDKILFDSRVAIDTHQVTSRINLDNQKELMTHEYFLREEAEDRASERRIRELRETIEGDIARIGAEAVKNSTGTASAEDIFNTVQQVNNEVRRIRNDSELTNDDKHSAIKTLLENLPAMIYRAGRHDG